MKGIESISFRTCLLDDKPIPIEESETYQQIQNVMGEDFDASKLTHDYVVEYGSDELKRQVEHVIGMHPPAIYTKRREAQ